jgi:phage-related minor tail protein|tara:strand:+ start:434 stop:847 length:414 start_codon:yes stop_codon:yes gene_type:complete
MLVSGLSFFKAQAQMEDLQAIGTAVEHLRQAMVDANPAALEQLTSPLLTYGHSSGLIEGQTEFIRAIVSGESNFTKIELEDQEVTLSDDVALVRHNLFGDTANKGKEPGKIRLGVLTTWQKTDGAWVLIGRQAFKLP